MQPEEKTPRRDERGTSPLGFTRTPSEDDPRRDPKLLAALERIAPGTELRQGIDDIIRSRDGALVVLDDVLVVLQRAEMNTRMAEEIERDCVELGTEGRLIRMQLEELVGHVPREKRAVLADYHAEGGEERTKEGLEALVALPYQDLLEFELLAVLGYPASVNPLDHSVSPRGFRVLSHIPRLPEGVIRRVVTSLDGLDAIVRASQRDLEEVEGVHPEAARRHR